MSWKTRTPLAHNQGSCFDCVKRLQVTDDWLTALCHENKRGIVCSHLALLVLAYSTFQVMLCAIITQQCLLWLPLLIKSAQHCVNDDVLVFVITSMCSVISWHRASMLLNTCCQSPALRLLKPSCTFCNGRMLHNV